jgi:hypothetical protein
MEYQRAVKTPALYHFILDRIKLTDILSDAKCFILYFKKNTFCTECSKLSYFTIICNDDGYKLDLL